MKILIVGGGGREHALAWKIAQSPLCEKLYCAPGNAGIGGVADCVEISGNDVAALAGFARDEKVDLTVVGPEEPLTLGLTDALRAEGLRVFGCTQRAALLEGSKVFAKQMMQRHSIPTGAFRVFQVAERAKAYIEGLEPPMVVKADGLAAGKGVIVCGTREEALEAVDLIMRDRAFGASGDQLVVEQFLEGEEASVLAFTDGKTIASMPSAQDHKQLLDGDRGPNTGGMGAYSPAPVVTPRLQQKIEREILVQTVHAMNREERPYEGVLYAGLMIGEAGPRVLEFNCRFGDPEAQPLVMRMKSDLVPVLAAVADGNLESAEIDWDPRPTLCVVLASEGYPSSPVKGRVIEGLEAAAKMPDTVVFHAGTKREGDRVVTSGGRVLGVTAIGETIVEAQQKAYAAVEQIHFEGMQFRTDIGQKAIDRLAAER
jgi:phosphoribosylamine--glycine ligase